MISAEHFYQFLLEKDVRFFTGVPDSLLKPFLSFVQDNADAGQHVITANEGLAIALASGYQLRTGQLPLVYLQNSGLGNIVNPVTSLADPEMYAIPMLLLIGWRGQPGTKDEPQHRKMGRITKPMLDALEIPVFLPEGDAPSILRTVGEAIATAQEAQRPVALLAGGNIFEPYSSSPIPDQYMLEREAVIASLINRLQGDEIVICTTGKIGREFEEQNRAAGGKMKAHLLSAGAMGHANHIALGLQEEGNTVVMLDGDGALLMHLGGLPTLATHHRGNFLHIVLNNGAHESVGGQPTGAFAIDLCTIAFSCGYSQAKQVSDQQELDQWLQDILPIRGLQFVEVRIKNSSRPNLGRPAGDPVQWKEELIRTIRKKK